MHTYSEISIHIGGLEPEEYLDLQTDNLEGEPNVVRISKGEGDEREVLGYYNIDQLINALNSIKNSNFQYMVPKE